MYFVCIVKILCFCEYNISIQSAQCIFSSLVQLHQIFFKSAHCITMSLILNFYTNYNMDESKITDYQSDTIENLKKYKCQFDQFALLSLSDHSELMCIL